jgi:hypothetical protein
LDAALIAADPTYFPSAVPSYLLAAAFDQLFLAALHEIGSSKMMMTVTSTSTTTVSLTTLNDIGQSRQLPMSTTIMTELTATLLKHKAICDCFKVLSNAIMNPPSTLKYVN